MPEGETIFRAARTLHDGTLLERQLQAGVSNWQFTEVVSGLRAGEKVVMSVERKGVVAGAKAVAE